MDFFNQLETLLKQDGQSVFETLADLGTPFVSIGILENHKISTTLLGSPTYNSQTIFQACSISKPITALAVLKLVQQGLLNLDVSISTYLTETQISWISTPKTESLVKIITLRMLLSHTSGLSINGFPGYTNNPPNISEILQGISPANTCTVRLEAFPGQRYSYSGGGITVIQLILETRLKKSFPEIMDEVILAPLEMSRSSYRFLDEEKESNWAPAYHTGYTKSKPSQHYQPEMAACGLWTTPNDLLLAVSAVQKSLDGSGFLEKELVEDMLRGNWG